MNGPRLKAELSALNCTASAFSALAIPPMTSRKMTQQNVSAIITNIKDFDNTNEANEFFGVVEAMKHLQSIVVPKVPVNWADVLNVKDLLVRTFEQRRNELDPLHCRGVWFIRLSVHNFFRGLRGDGSVIATPNYYGGEAAAFTNYDLAVECVKRLKKLGIDSRAEGLTCARRQSTITTSLEESGF